MPAIPMMAVRRRGGRLEAILVAFVMAVAGLSVMAVEPARAAVKTTWYVSETRNYGIGEFIWLNQSVQVGGAVQIWKTGYCAAVVFTAYDGSGNVRARAARPGDDEYYCTEGRHGFGFTLDPAGSPRGGIQRIRVDLWELNSYDIPFISDTKNYYRP